jgi:hypothetical protein
MYFVDSTNGRPTITRSPAVSESIRGVADLDGVIYCIRDNVLGDRLEIFDPLNQTYTLVGTTTFTGLQSLATSPTGRLLSWDVTGPGLVRIDPATGVATDVSPSQGTSGVAIQSLEFTPDGRLFGANDKQYLIDPDSGVPTFYSDPPYADARGLAASRNLVRISIDFQDYVGPYPAKVTIELRRVGTTEIVETLELPWALFESFGTYRYGTFDIAVKSSHWLRKVIPAVTFRPFQVIPPLAVSLINGDCDESNDVGIGDYAMLSAAFNSSAGDSNYDENADLNGDQSVDIGDYGILSTNFGAIGED